MISCAHEEAGPTHVLMAQIVLLALVELQHLRGGSAVQIFKHALQIPQKGIVRELRERERERAPQSIQHKKQKRSSTVR